MWDILKVGGQETTLFVKSIQNVFGNYVDISISYH